MGTVYLVEDLFAPGREVALKRVRQDRLDAKTLTILVNEFGSLAGLRHPNLARVWDFGVDHATDDVYFTVEYVDGPHWLKVARRLDLSRGDDLRVLLGLVVQVLRGLGFVHDRGLVHADIKPENILISGLKATGNAKKAPTAKLIDFGLTKREKAFGGKKIVGTTYYIAPETIRGARIDRRADLYSLGVVLYHLTTGQLPFRGKSNLAVFKGHLEERPTPPHEVATHIPLQLSEIVLRLMEKRPDDRFANTLEVIQEINREFGQNFTLETSETNEGHLECIRRSGRDAELTRLRAMFSRLTHTEVLGGDVGNDLADLSTGRDAGPARSAVSATVPPGQLAIVRGERGLGKRRLIETLRYRIETQGAKALEVECDPERVGSMVGFGGLVDLLALFEGREAGRPVPEFIERAQQLASSVDETSLESVTEEQWDIVAQTVDGVVESTQERPMLLHFHELHLAGPLVIAFVGELVGAIANRPPESCRLLVTASTLDHGDTEGSYLQELYASSLFRRSILDLKIDRLDREAVIRHVRSTFVPCEFPDDFLHKAFDESDGNPEILVDILGYFLREGMIRRSTVGWAVTGEYEGKAAPGKVRRELERRIRGLPADALRLAIAFAYLGDGGELEVAVKLAGTPSSEVPGALRVLRREKLIEEKIEGDPSNEFTFVYSSAKQILYDLLPENQRPAVHDRAGALYEEYLGVGAARDPGRLAYHFLRGLDSARGIEYGLAAAGVHAKEFRPRRAMELYRRILEKVASTDVTLRENVRESLATLQFQVGEYRSVIETLEPVCRLEGDGEAAEITPRVSNVQMAQALAFLGRFEDAASHLRHLVSGAHVQKQPEIMARAFLACAELHASKGNAVESLRCCDRVLGIEGEPRSRATLGRLHMLLAENHYRLDNPTMAAKYCQDALRVTDGEDGVAAPDANLYCLGKYYKYKGKLEKAVQQLELCCQINRKAGVAERQADCLLEIGNIYRLLERPRDALGPLEEACALYRRGNNVPYLAEARCSLGETHRLLGECDDAMPLLEDALDSAAKLGNREAEIRALLSYAELHLDRGAVEAAERYLGEIEALDARDTTSATLKSMELRFSLALRRGRVGDALGFANKGLEVCRQGENRTLSTRLLTERAVLHCRLGSRVDARRGMVQLLDIAQAHDFPLAEGRARMLEGIVQTAEGNASRADKAFQSALDIFTQLTSERDLVELHSHHGLLCLKTGRHEETYLHLEEGGYLAKKLNLEYTKTRYQFALGLLELAIPEGELGRAEERFLFAVNLAEKLRYIELQWQIEYQLGKLYQLTGREGNGETFLQRAKANRKRTLDGIPVSHRQGYLKTVDDPDLDALLETKVREGEAESAE